MLDFSLLKADAFELERVGIIYALEAVKGDYSTKLAAKVIAERLRADKINIGEAGVQIQKCRIPLAWDKIPRSPSPLDSIA